MRILFFVCDGILHQSCKGIPAQHRRSTANSIMDAGFFQWTPHLAEVLEDYNDVVLINECEWGATLKQRTFLQCLGPAAKWFAGTLDSRPDSIESARALFFTLARPVDWMRMLPASQPQNSGRVLLVDSTRGISSPAAKHAFRKKWKPGACNVTD